MADCRASALASLVLITLSRLLLLCTALSAHQTSVATVSELFTHLRSVSGAQNVTLTGAYAYAAIRLLQRSLQRPCRSHGRGQTKAHTAVPVAPWRCSSLSELLTCNALSCLQMTCTSIGQTGPLQCQSIALSF